MKKLRYTVLSFFLLLGLIVSSIGATWCHYQVVQDFPLTYFVKTSGKFKIESKHEEWSFDSMNQTYSNEFTISNQNEYENSLYLTFISTEKADYTLVLIEPSGREVRYDSILVHDEMMNYHYEFIDKESNQLKLEVNGKNKDKLNIRLEAKNVKAAFISEIVLEDAAFEVKENSQVLTANYEQLELNSNYLSLNDNVHVILSENTIELTFESNMFVTSKVKTNDRNVTLNVEENGQVVKYKEYDLTIQPYETKTLVLDVTNRNTSTITVEWEVYSGEEVIQTLKADFSMKQVDGGVASLEPIIDMNYIDDKNTFNQYEPIEFMIKSDISATVQIGFLYPANTYYSYDDGLNWYVITSEDTLRVPLVYGQDTKVIIDLSKSDIAWDEGFLDVTWEYYQFYGENDALSFEMELVEVEPFEIEEYDMGVLDEDGCSFTLDTENLVVVVEEYVDGMYVPLTEDYFTIERKGLFNYSITRNEENIPRGIYRVKIQQYYNDTLIKEEELNFFTIEEVDA